MTTLSNEQLREKIFSGKTMLQNVRDVVARNNTGYSYEELKNSTEDDGIDPAEEIEEVDKTVNLLLHLFSYHLASQRQAILEEVREEVIGNDHMHQLPDTVGSPYYTDEDIYQNKLRAEQRIKLDAIEKKV